jgi:hypothetical protein
MERKGKSDFGTDVAFFATLHLELAPGTDSLQLQVQK